MVRGGVLAGRTALVTGGSRGIGRSIVERFASEGASVVFSYVSDSSSAQALTRTLPVHAIQADLRSVSSICQLFDDAETLTEGLDVVVNNAGVGGGRDVSIEQTSEDHYDRVMTTNARGTFFCLREAARRVRDGGRIISVSSSVTKRGLSGTAVYAASKAAIDRFSATLAKEVGNRGITVNTISPGAIDTDLFRSANPPELAASIAASSPFGRLGLGHDVAAVALFLAGPDSGWITGQDLQVDGGLS